MTIASPAPSLRQLLLCGAAIGALSMGVRHGFGLFQAPITMDHGWSREPFSLAMAVQNLAWGLAGPVVGMLADRFGAWRTLIVSALLYALGLVAMALTTSPMTFLLGAGVLIGVAQAGCTYAVIFGVLARQVPAERRSWAMGTAAAAGSFGQFLMMPVSNWLIESVGWQNALQLLALAVCLIVPLALGLREPPAQPQTPEANAPPQRAGAALREAMGYRSFQLLMLGYLVCGFQVVFIGVHLPAFLKDSGLSSHVAPAALALIGLFNVVGTYAAGALGQRWPRRYLLAGIYSARALAIACFISLPLSPLSVYVFASVMGLLWLSTVPPTNAIVAQLFGVKHLSMLSGLVFLGHQIGSFMGVWLGGRLYDLQGSYTLVWWLTVALGLISAGLNLSLREDPVQRLPAGAVSA
ncbi:MFS transporter [Roseateles sp. BYS180W]|uniref:MFS transporter n=1 Tax=Roseateles rivi TaxID=3299028 RepID=A0ABW7FT10_9BURK